MKYEDALWMWFLNRAYKDAMYGFMPLTEAEKAHLLRCGINHDKSNEPEVGSVDTWGGTFEGTVRTGAIHSDYWICKCGRYGNHRDAKSRMPILAITGDYALGDIIREVIETGEEKRTPNKAKKGGKK